MLLTAAELAPHLQLSVGQVYRLARTKQIPCHHLGAAVRFNLADVIAATMNPPEHQTTAARTFALSRLQTRATTKGRIV